LGLFLKTPEIGVFFAIQMGFGLLPLGAFRVLFWVFAQRSFPNPDLGDGFFVPAAALVMPAAGLRGFAAGFQHQCPLIADSAPLVASLG